MDNVRMAETSDFVKKLTEYADQSDVTNDVFEIPESLSELSSEDLDNLYEEALENFKAMADSEELSDEELAEFEALTEGVERLQSERAERAEAVEQRKARKAELASRVLGESSDEGDPDGDDADEAEDDEDESTDSLALDPKKKKKVVVEAEDPSKGDDSEDDSEDDADTEDDGDTPPVKKKKKALTASSAAVRVRRQAKHLPKPKAEKTMKDYVFASGDGLQVAPGTGLDWPGVGAAIDKRLHGFNAGAYEAAARAGRHLSQQFGVASFKKPSSADLTITSNDPFEAESVLRRAMDESRLQGGSLVASGGWCAPSETLYDMCELESRDGQFSLPEVNVTRGGFSRTLGPNFADIFNSTGFAYTEAEDIAGNYDGQGGGEKPCYRVECPDFEEFRLNIAGLCLTAGLLQQKGYPELIARTARGALIAHDHKMSARIIEAVENGSVKVTMPGPALDTAAPLLSAIEKQVEHMRYSNRIARSATMEAVFPFWVRGAVREDLSRRNGLALLDVTDAQIQGWFTMRGIRPQFVYNWQDINLQDASGFTAWPTTVKFLLYPAGTWVKGGSNVITLDTLYDSQQLRTNDFTALFTEESWMVVKMCHDSRVVEVPLCASGATGQSVDMGCDTKELPKATTTSTTSTTSTTKANG